jgi:hypothetical protein
VRGTTGEVDEQCAAGGLGPNSQEAVRDRPPGAVLPRAPLVGAEFLVEHPAHVALSALQRAMEPPVTAAGSAGTAGDHYRGEPKHHPILCRTSRDGCWAYCTCGWISGTWTSTVGAHVDFGRHLVDTAPALGVAP